MEVYYSVTMSVRFSHLGLLLIDDLFQSRSLVDESILQIWIFY